MNNEAGKHLFVVCFLLLTFSFVARQETAAQSSQFILENEQHWETYCIGGSCISGTQNLFVADVDGDGISEIVTGGHTYNLVNGTRTDPVAPLKIWNWNGHNLTLEKTHKWPGRISSIYAGDANGDGTIEAVTVGSVTNSTGSYVQIRVWHWDNQELVLKAGYEGKTSAIARSSVSVSDVDGNGTPEIITVGKFCRGNGSSAQLCAWQYDGNSLTLKKSVDWGYANATFGYSLHVSDLNGDGTKEIVTGHFANDLKNSSGQLRIWKWNGEDFYVEANEEWRLKDSGYGLTISGSIMGNTMVNCVKVGDVDGDGVSEIITGGFAYDGENLNAQLRIWNWNDQSLNLEKSREWATQDITEIKALSINDVDGDGINEIVTSGVTAAAGSFYDPSSPQLSQLRVWGWDGTTLTLKHSPPDWFIDDGACAWNVATGDVDQDGVIEIVTVGCTFLSDMCDPDMRIWSIANSSSSTPATSSAWAIYIGVGAVITIIIAAATIAYRKKSNGRSNCIDIALEDRRKERELSKRAHFQCIIRYSSKLG